MITSETPSKALSNPARVTRIPAKRVRSRSTGPRRRQTSTRWERRDESHRPASTLPTFGCTVISCGPTANNTRSSRSLQPPSRPMPQPSDVGRTTMPRSRRPANSFGLHNDERAFRSKSKNFTEREDLRRLTQAMSMNPVSNRREIATSPDGPPAGWVLKHPSVPTPLAVALTAIGVPQRVRSLIRSFTTFRRNNLCPDTRTDRCRIRQHSAALHAIPPQESHATGRTRRIHGQPMIARPIPAVQGPSAATTGERFNPPE